MNKLKWLLFPVAAIIFSLGACTDQDASKVDVDEPKFNGKAIPEDYEARVPDKLTVYQNVDNHPTVVRMCLDGVAFRTVSINHQNGFTSAIERVPEWDEYCEN